MRKKIQQKEERTATKIKQAEARVKESEGVERQSASEMVRDSGQWFPVQLSVG